MIRPLYDIGPIIICSYQFHLGLVLAGVSALLIGLFSLVLAANWKSAMKAGRQYVNLRWLSIAAIERLSKVHRIGLATLENRWRQHSKEKSKGDFYPFKEVVGLDELGLPMLEGVRGWSSMDNVISFWQIICWLILITGIILILIGFFNPV